MRRQQLDPISLTEPPVRLVTVAVPTFNGERYLEDLLRSVTAQVTDFEFEILVIDSGSTDGTRSILSSYPTVRAVDIPNEEFGHGRTRNKAVELSRGDLIAFLTQDAVPASSTWLQSLVDGFSADPKVAGTFGPHIAREDADPKTRMDLKMFFGEFGVSVPLIQRLGDPFFFSDVNACIKKEVWRAIPYRDVSYAEDQAWGKDVLEAGFCKVYVPEAAVIHSHQYGPIEYLGRQIDEWKGLRDTVDLHTSAKVWRSLPGALRTTWKEAPGLVTEVKTLTAKVQVVLLCFWMNLARRLAASLVDRRTPLSEALVNRLSLEARVKRSRP